MDVRKAVVLLEKGRCHGDVADDGGYAERAGYLTTQAKDDPLEYVRVASKRKTAAAYAKALNRDALSLPCSVGIAEEEPSKVAERIAGSSR